MISIKPFSCSGVTQSPSCHEGLDPEKFEENIISDPNGIEKGAILNPKAIEEMSSVIFARLPNLLISNFEGEIMTAPLSQDEPHHELVSIQK